jgi:hypothetical protein
MYMFTTSYSSPEGTLVSPKPFVPDTVLYSKPFASPGPMMRSASASASATPVLRTSSSASAASSASYAPSMMGRYRYHGERRMDDELEVEVQLPAAPVPPTINVPMKGPDGRVQYVRAVHKGWTYERTPHRRANPYLRPVIVQPMDNSSDEEGPVTFGTMC